MDIQTIKISEIKPYPKNAKKHERKQIDLVASNINKFGWTQPIVIDKNNEVIIGHCRLLAAKKLGLEDVPVARFDNLTDDEVKALRLADNKSNESDWDMGFALDELKSLDKELFGLTGFDEDLIRTTREDDAPPLPGEPKSQRGDLYILGEHRLLCGDSENEEDYQKLFGDDKADLIFTDPPYSVNYVSPSGYSYDSTKYGNNKGKIFNDDKTDEEAEQFYRNVLNKLSKYSQDNASLYWWYATSKVNINRNAWAKEGWHFSQVVVWIKPSPVMSRGQLYHRCYEPCLVGWKEKSSHYFNKAFSGERDIWILDYENFQIQLDAWYNRRDNMSDYVHPTQKPVKLATRALARSSKAGDIVADMFGGSGSTLIGCEQMQRKCYMMELDPKYADVIVRRYVNYTGNEEVIKNGEKIVWTKTLKQQ